MGSFSLWHWIIVLAIVLVLFGGRGKISAIMGDFGKGLKSFKKGVKDDDDDDVVTQAREVPHEPRTPMSSPVTEPHTKKID